MRKTGVVILPSIPACTFQILWYTMNIKDGQKRGKIQMKPLTDSIEAFIKSLLEEGQEQVDVQRNELAQYFRCAPSQITYVLSTRFTPDHGYIIESRRGGGGYIRIVRLRESPGSNLLYLINQRIGLRHFPPGLRGHHLAASGKRRRDEKRSGPDARGRIQ